MTNWKVEYKDKNKWEDEIVVADAIQPFEHGVAFQVYVTSINQMVTIAILHDTMKVKAIVPEVKS